MPAVPPKELAQYPTVMEVPRLRTIETVGVDGKATKVVTSDRVVYTQTFDKGPVEMWRFRAYGV